MFTLKKVGANKKLLIVEDDKGLNEEIAEFFSIFFETVHSAYDGQDGVNKVLENDYDLIITDFNMPKLNGHDMSKEIKKLKNPDLPIILMSGQNHEIEKLPEQKCFDLILNKPFDYDYLCQNIIEGTSKNSCISSSKP